MARTVYEHLCDARASRQPLFAVLLDPDKCLPEQVPALCNAAANARVDMWLVGGSLIREDQLDAIVLALKTYSDIPVVLFPGSTLQITPAADALLLLSLISGRNPDLLIGRQVEAAPRLAASQLEIIPTGYLLIDGGAPTSVSYMSHTFPIPANKPEIAAVTALAGAQLGLQATYLDAGSGAKQAITPDMVKQVREQVSGPLFVGGGLRRTDQIQTLCQAGADVIVVGNALEAELALMEELSKAVHATKIVSW